MLSEVQGRAPTKGLVCVWMSKDERQQGIRSQLHCVVAQILQQQTPEEELREARKKALSCTEMPAFLPGPWGLPSVTPGSTWLPLLVER